MGLLRDLITGRRVGVLDPSPLPLTNTFSDASSSTLARFVLPEEIARVLPDELNRTEAASIPAVARGRNLLVSAIAPLPLVALTGDTPSTAQPTFLYRTDGAATVYDRMARTVDSLIFHGLALWAVARGADGTILDAAWCPHDRWRIDRLGQILVDGRPVDSREVILFAHVSGGLLATASRTLRAAVDIERAVARNAKNPVPLTAFEHTETNATQLEDDEISDLLGQWRTARQSPDGATGYIPPGLRMVTPAQPIDAAMLVDARNGVRMDVASFLNIPVAMLDGSTAQGSLTYTTQEGTRNRFDAEALPFWTDPIAWRLSQDDVVPRGQRVRFDLSERLVAAQSPTGALAHD